jgi:hypothetical protein
VISSIFDVPFGAPPALATLVRLAQRMPEATRGLWEARFTQVYGDLGGQRRVDVAELRDRFGLHDDPASVQDIVFGIQSTFVLIVDLLAVSTLEKDAETFLRQAANLGRRDFRAFLRALSRGRALEDRGVSGARHAFDLDWYVELCRTEDLERLAATVRLVSERWRDVEATLSTPDPLSPLYASLLPRNLRHILGEVYTPCWLAEMLLRDAEWSPGTRVLDPFGGSGAFALAALRIGSQAGAAPVELLRDVCLVDLNPIACAAARANLVLFLSRSVGFTPGRTEVHLPVLSGDSLASAVLPASPAEPGRQNERAAIRAGLCRYNVRLDGWLEPSEPEHDVPSPDPRGEASAGDRLEWEQRAVLCLRKADLVATNPPWVGWEYMARPYRAYLEPAWKEYDLYTAKGKEASFVKDDLSTLALTVAWDRYLRDGGTSVAVLRRNAMTSTLAAKGLRRLTLRPGRDPLRLIAARTFEGTKIFPMADVQAATWLVEKGASTEFPVPVTEVRGPRPGWRPPTDVWLDGIEGQLIQRETVAERATLDSGESRWVIGSRTCVEAARALSGSSPYVGRTGVFTGGANAVYYLRPENRDLSNDVAWFQNVTERAKRGAPEVRAELETDLVFDVIRGRDVARWGYATELQLLCPHTRETRMRALPPEILQARYPRAWSYLERMRPILDRRRGFTTWERSFRDAAFYAIQRVGEYTFAPYKVVWKYIAKDFVVAVVGPGQDGKPRLPNDKVIFVGLDDPDEAYYLAGLLSSDPIRWRVVAHAATTQISANAIESLRIPRFRAETPEHRALAAACERGHAAIARGDATAARGALDEIHRLASHVLSLDADAMAAFHEDLRRRYPNDWTVRPAEARHALGSTLNRSVPPASISTESPS